MKILERAGAIMPEPLSVICRMGRWRSSRLASRVILGFGVFSRASRAFFSRLMRTASRSSRSAWSVRSGGVISTYKGMFLSLSSV